MVAVVDVWNLALGKMGARGDVADPREQSAQARKLSVHWATARDMAVQSHDWSFARRRVTLALLPTVPPGWLFGYALPSDCLVFRGIFNGVAWNRAPFVPYETGADVDYENRPTRAVYTNLAGAAGLYARQAVGVYTARTDEPLNWPPLFVDLVAWTLAASAAFDITGNANLGPAIQKMLPTHMQTAIAADMKQDRPALPTTESVPDWITTREFSSDAIGIAYDPVTRTIVPTLG